MNAAVMDAYAALCNRATALVAPKDARFLADLGEHWAARLRALPDEPLDPAGQAALDWLMKTIASPRLDDDAVVHWVDAFPDAVCDLWSRAA